MAPLNVVAEGSRCTMPTPRKAATPRTATTPDTDIDNEIPPPTWDTSEDTRSAWLQELDRWMPGQYPEYTTLIESGFITRHGKGFLAPSHIPATRLSPCE